MKNICIDIGGKSSKVAVFDEEVIITKEVIEYPDQNIHVKDLEKLLETKIKKFIDEFGIQNVCISSPGVVDCDTGVISGLSAIIELNTVNFKESLNKKFNKPVFIENDANCAVLAEIKQGNLQNVKNAVALIIGTGLGGAIVINKKIYKGSHLNAGEFGCGLFQLNNENYENNSEHCAMLGLEYIYFKKTNLKKQQRKYLKFISSIMTLSTPLTCSLTI